MCLVIDSCCLAMVFDKGNKRHSDFEPVARWVLVGKGKMIYGGQKYKGELKKAKFIIPIMAELDRSGRLVHLRDSEVDARARELKEDINDNGFNDEHVVAMVVVSRCSVVCTDDRLAIQVLKYRHVYYRYKMKPPKIYRYARHRNMCTDENLAAICR